MAGVAVGRSSGGFDNGQDGPCPRPPSEMSVKEGLGAATSFLHSAVLAPFRRSHRARPAESSQTLTGVRLGFPATAREGITP
jgi:hypothetical protein